MSMSSDGAASTRRTVCAASRAVAEVGAARLPTGLAAYVADGKRHEDARPCKVGTHTAGVYVKMQRLEELPHTRR